VANCKKLAKTISTGLLTPPFLSFQGKD
jgi:hypothetical protein